jgi:hypothetical protein
LTLDFAIYALNFVLSALSFAFGLLVPRSGYDPKPRVGALANPGVPGFSYTNPERVAPSFVLDRETQGHNRVAVDIHAHLIPRVAQSRNPGL